MNLPDGRPMVVHEGILLEPSSAGGRVVLWVPGERARGFHYWDRVGTVARAGVVVERGISTMPATSVPARQRVGWDFGKRLRSLGTAKEVRSWTLPGGGLAEQCGDRRMDLLLAWSQDEAAGITLDGSHARWGETSQIRSLGPNLFLVSGVEPAGRVVAPATLTGPDANASETSRQVAERALTAAKEGGDPLRLSVALADLGLALLQAEERKEARVLMERAVAEACRSGDGGQEIDASIDLGLALLASGHPSRAEEVLGQALAGAHEAGRRFAEKAALDRLGQCRMALGDPAGALKHFERAMAIASELGDQGHEAELLWHVGLQHAELGRRERAMVMAGAAVDRMRRLGRPQAAWYAHHLDLFRSGGAAPPTRGPSGESPWSSTIDTGVVVPSAATPVPAEGPGPLRMALSAIGSMAKFLGSGYRVADAETYRDRLGSCGRCEHHTGLRCRACGCFTAAKARLLHERCPIGRWRA